MDEYVKVYDRTGALQGVLENAGEISYQLPENDLWTGSFALPERDPKNDLCRAFSLVRLPDGTRDLGLYRIIAAPESAIGEPGGVTTYSVEHVMATLLDDLLIGVHEVTGFQAALRYILARQTETLWQLGQCDFDDALPHRFEDTPLLTAMMDLAQELTEEYTWHFDTGTAPWTVSLKRADQEPGCGIYYRRNMQGIRKSMDATRVVTRLTPLGWKDEESRLTVATVNGGRDYIDADTIGTWGCKCAKWVNLQIEDPAVLLSQGRWILEQNKNPYMAYEVDVLDLYMQTGQRWDDIMPGRLVQVMDGEHGISLQTRVKKVEKRNVRGDPGRILVTLANAPREITDVLTREIARAEKAEASLSARVNSASSAVKAETQRATRSESQMSTQLTAHDRHITDIGTILHEAGLEIDAHGVWLFAKEQGALGTMQAGLNVAADSIAAEVTRATAAEGTMTAQLNVQAGQISSKVSQTDYNGNTIASLINQTATTILIQAARINLSGYVTASALDAQIAQLSSAIAQNITTNRFSCVHGSADYMTVYNTLTLGGGEGGGANVGSAIAGIGTATESGGQITIPTTTLTGSAGPSINFNIADTQFYRNAVASAETNGWNAARAKVAMPGRGTETSFTVDVPSATQGEKQTYTFTMQKGATPGTSGYASVALGQSVVGRISIGDWYSAGYSAGFTAGQSAGESIGYTRGWNAAEAQYSAASYARKNLNRYGHAELYVKERETYYSAGNHYWYWSGSDGWDTLYTKSSS